MTETAYTELVATRICGSTSEVPILKVKGEEQPRVFTGLLVSLIAIVFLLCCCCCGAGILVSFVSKKILKENERLNRFSNLDEVPPVISDEDSQIRKK